jgi:hypothetical protein
MPHAPKPHFKAGPECLHFPDAVYAISGRD